MGGGTWTTSSFTSYSKSVGRATTVDGLLDSSYTAQDLFKQRRLAPELNPYNVVRECRDTEEHPNTIASLNSLACTYSALGEHKKAFEFNENVYALILL